jgi:CheY-like chemotaxis protein
MEPPGMVAPNDEFKSLVKDALSHLYDIGYLQNHPLLEQVAIETGNVAAGGKARALFQALYDSIEELNPGSEHNRPAKPVRFYQILRKRYVEGIKAQDVALQLALSERQLFRELEHAIDSLCEVLWARYSSNPIEDISGPAETSVASEALLITQYESEQWVNLIEVLEGLIVDLKPALDRRGSRLIIRPQLIDRLPSQRIPVFTNRTLLRQLLMTLIAAISAQYPGLPCEIDYQEDAASSAILLNYPGDPSPEQLQATITSLQEDRTVNELLEVLNAHLYYEGSAEGLRVELQLRSSRQTILIVEDNAETVRLFRRYLSLKAYRIFDAPTLNQALVFQREMNIPVHLILMDVMMPDQDGWEGLQKIKIHPELKDVPVVICSVLNQPEIAAALGASGYLRKPFSQDELIGVVEKYIIPE